MALSYSTREEQIQLLQQVQEANDNQADEEQLPTEFQSGSSGQRGPKYGRQGSFIDYKL